MSFLLPETNIGRSLSSNSETFPKTLILPLVGIYLTQSVGMIFVFLTVPIILRGAGHSLGQIAVFSLIGLVWPLKFLWAPIVDRLGAGKAHHYRRWLICTQTLLSLSIALAGFFEPSDNLAKLMVCLIAMALIAATQDIAADGYCVKTFTTSQRGSGSAIQVSGSFLGSLLGGGVGLIVYDWIGWSWTMWGMAMITSLALFAIRTAPEKTLVSKPATYGAIIHFFLDRRIWTWILLLALARASFGPAHAVLSPMLVDNGWTTIEIAIFKSFAVIVAGLVGAMVAGAALRIFDRAVVLRVSLAANLLASAILYFTLSPQSGHFVVFVVVIAFQVPYGATLTALLTYMMDRSRPENAGTDFSVQYSLSFMAGIAAGAGALVLAEIMGYSYAFGLGATIASVAMLLALLSNGHVEVKSESRN